MKTSFLESPEIHLKTLDEKKENMIPAIIADPYCREILQATKFIPKSIIEIYADTKIPISTTYRRVQSLCDAGLLKTTGTISEDGKKFFLYKSAVKEVLIKFDGSLHVKTTPNS